MRTITDKKNKVYNIADPPDLSNNQTIKHGIKNENKDKYKFN